MSGYGQFCPVAKAMEVLDERWTLLVVRELLLGSRHWGDLRRGVPRMSPALLSKRLQSLERHGIVVRQGSGTATAYDLTEAGRDLYDVVMSLGAWGIRWVGDLGDEDLDPHLLMWDMRRTVPVDRWPTGRTVVEVVLTDRRGRGSHWWFVVQPGAAEPVDVCDTDPGHPVTATVTTTLRELTRIWRADVAWARAVREGTLSVVAPREVAEQVPEWFGHSVLGGVPRPVPAA